MLIQAVILWVVVVIEAVLVAALVTRFGGLSVVFTRRGNNDGDVDALVGHPLPPLGVIPCGAGASAKPRKQTIAFDGGSLLIFVTARCVASTVLLGALQDHLLRNAPGFPVVIGLVGSHRDLERVLDEFPPRDRAIELVERGFVKRFADSIPFAVSLGEDGSVAHAGSVDCLEALRKFVEACGSATIRDWFSAGDHSGAGATAASALEPLGG